MEHPAYSRLVVSQDDYHFSCFVPDGSYLGLSDFAELCDAAIEEKLGYLDPARTWAWLDRHNFVTGRV